MKTPVQTLAPHLSAAWVLADAWVMCDYDARTVTVRQPARLGGTVVAQMEEYDSFEGNMAAFVLELRRRRREEDV